MPYSENSPAAPVLVELTRGAVSDVFHRGHVCVVSAEGELVFSKGDPDFKTFLRSSAKPFQAAAVILSGAADKFGLTDREIAMLAGSHGGETIHTDLVVQMLSRGGLSVAHLQCGIHPPLEENARNELIRSGQPPSPLHHNCSAKHSGMILTALHLGSSVGDYLKPDQPGQRLIRSVIAQTAGIAESEIEIAFDGCSAPVHTVPVRGIARMFARLVRPVGLENELANALNRVAKAMRAYPELVAATRGRICTELMKVGQEAEITAKAGAEGVYGVGWFDRQGGRALGLGVKMEDGQQRGRDPVTLKMLQKFGVLPEELPENLKPMAAEKLTNWRGIEIGKTIVRI